MKCEKIQELILTDYFDGNMDLIQEEKLKEHLKVCSSCREFLKVANETSIEPFIKAERNHMSQEVVWSRVKENIAKEKVFSDELIHQPSLWYQLKVAFSFPRPAFVFGTMLTVMLIVMVFNRGDLYRQEELVDLGESGESEVEYVNYLLNDDEYELAYEAESSQGELDAYYL